MMSLPQGFGGWKVASGLLLASLAWSPAVLAQSRAQFVSNRAVTPTVAVSSEVSALEPEPARRWTPPQDRIASRSSARWSDPSMRAAAQRSSRAAQGPTPVARRSSHPAMEVDVQIQQGAIVSGPVEHVQPFQSEMEPEAFGYDQGPPMPHPDGCGCGDCGDACGGCDACGDCGGYGRKHCICIDLCWFQDLEVGAGVQGFKGPVDLGVNGNFGFNQQINWGAPFPFLECSGIGFQIGARAVESNLHSGALTTPFPGGANRNQVFTTAGLFRRTLCGVQWGVAIDTLHDNYYVNMDLSQIRGEISYVGRGCNEIGFWFTSSLEQADGQFTSYAFNNEELTFDEHWRVTNIYAAFYRKKFCNGADARIWGGLTDRGDGVFGGEFYIPLGTHFGMSANATYLIPQEGRDNGAAQQEAWAIGLNFAWYPFRSCRCRPQDDCWGKIRQYRPLFNVADNSNFLVDRTGTLNALLP
jgi:hypothetical protein